MEMCTKNLKLRGEYRTITIKPNQIQTHKTYVEETWTSHTVLCHCYITYYTVPLLHHILYSATATSHTILCRCYITYYTVPLLHHILYCATATSHTILCHCYITYYTVPLLPVCKKTASPTKIRNNKEEHIRSTWSSLYLISLLSKGIYAEEIFGYGWYIGFVTCHLSLVLAFPTPAIQDSSVGISTIWTVWG
jgi:hypothetical protein